MSDKLVPLNPTTTLENYVYTYGKSLMNCSVNDCPLEVFKPQSNYYNSLLQNIEQFESVIKHSEEKLKLFDKEAIETFVNENFDEQYDTLDHKIEKKLKQYEAIKDKYELVEEDLEDIENLKNMQKNLPEIIENRIINKYYRENHIYKEMEQELHDQIVVYDRLVHEQKFTLAEWKEKCLKREQEEEKKRLIEYLSIPHSNKDVIRNLNEFVHKCVNNNYTELLDEYYDMYKQAFDEISRNKYEKTIKSVFDTKSSQKVIKAFTEHNQTLINRLQFLIAKIQFNETEEYLTIEKYLKNSFEKFISDHFMTIYNFMKNSIGSIAKSSVTFENSTAIKVYAQSIVRDINQVLIRDLPEVLESRFSDYLQTLMEKLGINTEEKHEVKVKVQSIELSFDSFLDAVPDGELEIGELCEMYNNYFGTAMTTRSFSLLKVVREHFSKRSIEKNKKKITYYCKM